MAKPRILIVEDERIVALNLRQQLTKFGYDAPVAVASGAQALESIEEARPDLVLMDINIEGPLDGIATAARIPSEYRLPVIYLTAYSEDETLKRAAATNPYGYLLKPISERELYAMLQVTLARNHAEATLRIADGRLREARKIEAIGQIAGGVAHQFNNILTIICGNLELLSDRTDDDIDAGVLLQEAFSASVRGEKLTQQLLASSRQQPLQPGTVSVNDFISGMIPGLRGTLEGSTQTTLRLPDDLWKIAIDTEEFEKALLNLADNAHEAMPDGGILTIAGRNEIVDEASADAHDGISPGRYVILSVTDTGRGMSQQALERAFEPFFTTKAAGTGLGLSQVLGFVKQSGGHVRVESTLGSGTSVHLCLPAISEAVESVTPTVAHNPEPRVQQGEVVLVVDDEAVVRKQVTGLPTRLGYKTIDAADGVAARALLAGSEQIDLLLTDVVMPNDLDGAELAREAVISRPDLKVLYMSGYTKKSLIQDGVIDGAVHLLTKPFMRSELAAKVREVLSSGTGG
jgi:CheY-like chemotaxis protein